MPARARSDDVDPLQCAKFLATNGHLIQLDHAVGQRYPRRNGVVQPLWLLEDLLDHVVRELTLIGHASLRSRYVVSDGYATCPRTIVCRTSPLEVSATRSATAPGTSWPAVASSRAAFAGLNVARRTACCKFQFANFMTLRTALSSVRTLPASFPLATHLPLATSTSSDPSRYFPSGMPVAAVASVTSTAPSVPLARRNNSTTIGSM